MPRHTHRIGRLTVVRHPYGIDVLWRKELVAWSAPLMAAITRRAQPCGHIQHGLTLRWSDGILLRVGKRMYAVNAPGKRVRLIRVDRHGSTHVTYRRQTWSGSSRQSPSARRSAA